MSYKAKYSHTNGDDRPILINDVTGTKSKGEANAPEPQH